MARAWFHGALPTSKATALLEDNGLTDGLFLVRENRHTALILSMAHAGKVHHIALRRDTRRGCFFVNEYAMPAQSLSDLIYQLHDPGLTMAGSTPLIPCPLRLAVFCTPDTTAPRLPSRPVSGTDSSERAAPVAHTERMYVNVVEWGSKVNEQIDQDYENLVALDEPPPKANTLSFEPLHDTVSAAHDRHASLSTPLSTFRALEASAKPSWRGPPVDSAPPGPNATFVGQMSAALPEVLPRRVSTRAAEPRPMMPIPDAAPAPAPDNLAPLDTPSRLPTRSSETACSVLNDAIQRHARDNLHSGVSVASPIFNGFFTFRLSNRRSDQIVLSLVHLGVVVHYDILQSTDGHSTLFGVVAQRGRPGVGRMFRSLRELVAFHQTTQNDLPCLLKTFVP